MLRHPSIIRFVGVLDDPDRLCIITTWMQNGELNAYLRAQPDAPKRPLARQVAAGLRYLRSQWIVHGDIKGANILIDGHGRAQIADFGSARVVVPFPDRRIFPPDATQSTGGTCRWMAPELLLPAQFSMHTFQSDVFSFGMVLYEIFSDGEIPFDDQPNSMAANLAIIRGNRPPRPPNTPADIWAVATACWRADPASRPAISSIII
ncbi:kinase-like domain-containing protein [Mycena latifolia]|nr:kinase-like domain-containing protein [Mycena latifolia]